MRSTKQIAPALQKTGMITDAQWGDVNGDGNPDLVIAGEWMLIRLFLNNSGMLEEVDAPGLDSTSGWWNSIVLKDLDGDGDLDFIAGNHGLNSRFEASKTEPAELWSGDFDENGTLEQVLSTKKEGEAYPMALRHDLIEQIPSLEEKYPDYESFAGESVTDIFRGEKLKMATHSQAYQLASVVGWNNGVGAFKITELPMRAQLSPNVWALVC
ncbi:MAG: VCBS repeat-containing protein [Balneolaceae bacterium]|nr:VCBS repeat-containing protein [Balneolaceae bacterium]